jgi:hypothetical protein
MARLRRAKADKEVKVVKADKAGKVANADAAVDTQQNVEIEE